MVWALYRYPKSSLYAAKVHHVLKEAERPRSTSSSGSFVDLVLHKATVFCLGVCAHSKEHIVHIFAGTGSTLPSVHITIRIPVLPA